MTCSMRFLSCVLLTIILGAVHGYYGDYLCKDGKDVFVQLFEWKWTDVANECENFLADNGFCAVQVSPPNEHRVVVGDSGYKNYPWWQRYQPVSYKMGSRSGTEAQFKDMVRRCNKAGVRIYVDLVLNHMTGAGSGVGSDGSYFDGDKMDFPGVPYSSWDFHGDDVCHTSDQGVHNYNDPQEVRFCRLMGLLDLRQSQEYVRNKIAGFLNKLVDWGVAGFRLDAAKHMLPADLLNIVNRLHNLNTDWFPSGKRPFIYLEVIDLVNTPIKSTDYAHIGRVTEFKYGMYLGDVIRKNNNQKLKYLKNFGEGWGFITGLSAIAFIDNHDNQRGHGAGGVIHRLVTFFETKMYKMANAFQLAWPYGYVRVMSSYLWPRNIQGEVDVNDWMGPPSHEGGKTKDVACFDDWICEHRWPQITNMVRFHNTVVSTVVKNWWDNGNNAIAFSRGDKGFIVINNEDYSISRTFMVGLPDGEYCDVISCDTNRPPCGECRPKIRVMCGLATITVPNDEDPVVAIHV